MLIAKKGPASFKIHYQPSVTVLIWERGCKALHYNQMVWERPPAQLTSSGSIFETRVVRDNSSTFLRDFFSLEVHTLRLVVIILPGEQKTSMRNMHILLKTFSLV